MAPTRRSFRTTITLGIAFVAMGTFGYALDWWFHGRPPAIEPALGRADGKLTSPDELKVLADPTTGAALLAVARAATEGHENNEATRALAGLAGRRVFVCRYVPPAVSACATATGDTIAAAVATAARSLPPRSAGETAGAAHAERLKVDVVTGADGARMGGALDDVPYALMGKVGYWVDSGGSPAWTVPSETIERGLYQAGDDSDGLARDRVVDLLHERAPDLPVLARRFGYRRLATTAWIEDHERHPLRVMRVHADHAPSLDADDLLERIVWAADYLLSATDQSGRIRYHHDVVAGEDARDYNWLRHAGATWALLRVYERTHESAYLRAADKAIELFLLQCKRDTRRGPMGGGETLWLDGGGNSIELGGAALGLLALAARARVTGDVTRHRDEARALALFIVAQQKTTGELSVFAPRDPGSPDPGGTSPYYAGEAILALMKWWSIDPDAQWIETAARGADHLIHTRDKDVADQDLPNDHWLMMGLSDLYRARHNPEHLAHALRLARGIQAQAHTGAVSDVGDYHGGYYDPPRSTPAATRAEGLVAVVDACALAGQPCPWVENLLRSTIEHQLLSQYTPDTDYWPRDRARVFGAFAGGILDPSVRNDFIQHNVCALLGMERLLRKDALPEVTEPLRARLHQWSHAFRGPTAWEAAPTP